METQIAIQLRAAVDQLLAEHQEIPIKELNNLTSYFKQVTKQNWTPYFVMEFVRIRQRKLSAKHSKEENNEQKKEETTQP